MNKILTSTESIPDIELSSELEGNIISQDNYGTVVHEVIVETGSFNKSDIYKASGVMVTRNSGVVHFVRAGGRYEKFTRRPDTSNKEVSAVRQLVRRNELANFIDKFKNEVLSLLEEGDEMGALKKEFVLIEEKLVNEEYRFIDKFLSLFPSELFPLKLLIGVLSATNRWKNYLTTRSALLEKVEQSIIADYGMDRVEPVLGGLK